MEKKDSIWTLVEKPRTDPIWSITETGSQLEAERQRGGRSHGTGWQSFHDLAGAAGHLNGPYARVRTR